MPQVAKDRYVVRDDAQLMLAIAQGDKDAYTVFVTLHIKQIIDVAMRYLGQRSDAEDIAQQTFTQLWLKASTWHDNKTSPMNWLYRVACNLCIDSLRKRHPQMYADTSDLFVDELTTNETPESVLLQEREEEMVLNAICQLPERQQTAIVLCCYHGLSNIDAASIMEITIEALESLLARGRRKLKTQLLDIEGVVS